MWFFMQTILIKKKHCLLTTFDCRMLSCALFSRVNVIKTEKKIKKKDGTSSDKKSEEKTESTKKSEPSKETKVVPSSPKAKKVLASYFVV